MRKWCPLLKVIWRSDMIVVALTIANVIGAVVIVTVLEHYFRACPSLNSPTQILTTFDLLAVIAAFFIAIGYQYLAAFYRSSARELKRIGMCHSVSVGACILIHGDRFYATFLPVCSLCRITLRPPNDQKLWGCRSVPQRQHVLHRPWGPCRFPHSDEPKVCICSNQIDALIDIVTPRWLAIRLDFLGGIMSFVVRTVCSDENIYEITIIYR